MYKDRAYPGVQFIDLTPLTTTKMAAVLPQPSNPFKQTPLLPGQYPKQRKLLSEDDKKVGPTALDLADE